jgi:hypothetical protein
MINTDADRAQRGESCVTGDGGPDAEQKCEIRITWHVPNGHVAHPPETFEYRPEIGQALGRAHEILDEERAGWGAGSDTGVTVEAVHVRRPGEGWYHVTSSR